MKPSRGGESASWTGVVVVSELAGVMWSNGVNLTEKPRKASQKSNKDATARRDRCPRVGESFIKRRKGKEKKRKKKRRDDENKRQQMDD